MATKKLKKAKKLGKATTLKIMLNLGGRRK